MGLARSFRILQKSPTAFGKELGDRNDEKPLFTQSYELGLLSKLNKNWWFNLGISYTSFGEQYQIDWVDSSFAYQNKYNWLAVPFRIQFEGPSKIGFFINSGLQGQMLSSYRHEEQRSIDGINSESTDKSTSNIRGISLSTTSVLGIKPKISPQVRLILAYSFQFQLSNSYVKQFAYTHQAYSHMFRFGFQWSR